MSKTDVHRPWAVQLADPYNRHLFYRLQIWPWEHGLIPFKNLGCGCPMCTGHHERKATRRDLRGLRAQAVAGDLDEDGPLPRRVDAW